jgi:hypothetical protein
MGSQTAPAPIVSTSLWTTPGAVVSAAVPTHAPAPARAPAPAPVLSGSVSDVNKLLWISLCHHCGKYLVTSMFVYVTRYVTQVELPWVPMNSLGEACAAGDIRSIAHLLESGDSVNDFIVRVTQFPCLPPVARLLAPHVPLAWLVSLVHAVPSCMVALCTADRGW